MLPWQEALPRHVTFADDAPHASGFFSNLAFRCSPHCRRRRMCAALAYQAAAMTGGFERIVKLIA